MELDAQQQQLQAWHTTICAVTRINRSQNDIHKSCIKNSGAKKKKITKTIKYRQGYITQAATLNYWRLWLRQQEMRKMN